MATLLVASLPGGEVTINLMNGRELLGSCQSIGTQSIIGHGYYLDNYIGKLCSG